MLAVPFIAFLKTTCNSSRKRLKSAPDDTVRSVFLAVVFHNTDLDVSRKRNVHFHNRVWSTGGAPFFLTQNHRRL